MPRSRNRKKNRKPSVSKGAHVQQRHVIGHKAAKAVGSQVNVATDPVPEEVDRFDQCIAGGDLDGARGEIKGLEMKYPKSTGVQVMKVGLLRARGQSLKAFSEVRKLKGAESQYPSIALLQDALSLEIGRGRDLEAMRSVVRNFPDHPAVEDTRLRLALHDRQDDEAVKHLFERKPENRYDPGVVTRVNYRARIAHVEDFFASLGGEASVSAQFFRADDILRQAMGVGPRGEVYMQAASYLYRQANAALDAEIRKSRRSATERAGGPLTMRQACQAWLMSGLTPGWFSERAHLGSNRVREVFVTGGPKAGSTFFTSLLEGVQEIMPWSERHGIGQVLSELVGSDPGRIAAFLNGEGDVTPEMVRQKMAERLRFDRTPWQVVEGSWLLQILPLISLIHPVAPMVFVRRDPMERGLSIYLSSPAIHKRDTGDLFAIGQSLAAVDQLIEFYIHVLPNPKILVTHDRMMSNPEGLRDSIIDRLGSKPRQGISIQNAGYWLHPADSVRAFFGVGQHGGVLDAFETEAAEIMAGYLDEQEILARLPEHDPGEPITLEGRRSGSMLSRALGFMRRPGWSDTTA